MGSSICKARGDDEMDLKKHLVSGSENKSRTSRSWSSVREFFDGKRPENNAALTTFLLLNTMIGSGILNQPYVFYESGIVGAIFGFIVASVLTWLGLLILNGSGVKVFIFVFAPPLCHPTSLPIPTNQSAFNSTTEKIL